MPSLFATLCSRTKNVPYSFPIVDGANALKEFAGNREDERQIEACARATYPVAHVKLNRLLEDFLRSKQRHRSHQAIYRPHHQASPDDVSWLLNRLLVRRPLTFMFACDSFLLSNGKSAADGRAIFDAIGTDKQHPAVPLDEFLSYEEIPIAALLLMSTPTLFINDGDRHNQGVPGEPATFERYGVYYGMVGARFERPRRMEWQHMVVDRTQNTSRRGYGPDPSQARDPHSRSLLDAWAKLYGCRGVDSVTWSGDDAQGRFYFPTYAEVANGVKRGDLTDRYAKVGRSGEAPMFFDKLVYKQRMRMIVEPFLMDANQRAKQANKSAYCHIVGLGLGVWLFSKVQTQLLIEVYIEVLESVKLPHVSHLVFSYFHTDRSTNVHADRAIAHGKSKTFPNGNVVDVEFSRRNPAARLDAALAERVLLCAQYAWDGNSYPGNEYWMGSLRASGDPAAVCCSLLGELQNPDINVEQVSGHATVTYPLAADPVVPSEIAPKATKRARRSS